MLSLESPLRGDSNEYTQYTSFNIKQKNPKLSQICSYGIFSKGLKNEFETAVLNEPLVFEPSKFYFIYLFIYLFMLLQMTTKEMHAVPAVLLLLSLTTGTISSDGKCIFLFMLFNE